MFFHTLLSKHYFQNLSLLNKMDLFFHLLLCRSDDLHVFDTECEVIETGQESYLVIPGSK